MEALRKPLEWLKETLFLKIGNVETNKIEDLVNEIQKRKVGDLVRILALRNGREHFFELKLSEAP